MLSDTPGQGGQHAMDTAGRVGLLLVDPAVAPQPDPRVRRASRISHRSDVQAQGRSRDEPGCSSATCLHARSWPGIQLQVPLANLSDPFPHPRRAVGAGGVPVVGPGPRPASRRGAQDAAAGRASQWILVSFGHAAPRAHETLGVRPRALEDGGDAVVPRTSPPSILTTRGSVLGCPASQTRRARQDRRRGPGGRGRYGRSWRA